MLLIILDVAILPTWIKTLENQMTWNSLLNKSRKQNSGGNLFTYKRHKSLHRAC